MLHVRKIEFQNASIPYSRLHDVYGAFASNRFVDIPNIFRDFDKDENDPASYDFAFTDVLIEAMLSYGIKPVFRLGVTIENQANIKAFNIYPPKDFAKWARICEHIIRHYNEGWANGFCYGIEYWEIWNEPENRHQIDLNQMWRGTAEEYFALYDVAAKHLKACFGDSIKVGGYGASEMSGIFYNPEKYGIKFPMDAPDEKQERYEYRVWFFEEFLKYAKAHNSPMDFFSWHSYKDVAKTVALDEYIHRMLCENGYGDVEIHLNEWNNAHTTDLHGSSYASAAAAAMMLALQNGHTDMLMYYDAKYTASTYGGFFAPLTAEPTATYYAFVAFSKLYKLGTQVEVAIDCESKEFYSVGATDGKKNALMIVNRTGETQELKIEGVDLADARYYILDKTHLLSMAFDADSIPNDTAMLIEW